MPCLPEDAADAATTAKKMAEAAKAAFAKRSEWAAEMVA